MFISINIYAGSNLMKTARRVVAKDEKTAQRRRRGIYWLVAGKAEWDSWLNLFVA